MIYIRSYIQADTQQIIKLILDIQLLEFQVPITLEEQPDLLKIADYYQKAGGDFWVAHTETGEIVGTIALVNCGGAVGCVRKMFVKKAFRGLPFQIAQKLLNKLVSFAQSKNIKAIYLGTVAKLQAAIAFYQRNGFEFLPKENLPAQFPIMAVDTHFYVKHINQTVEIIDYELQYAQQFLDINIEWISVHFTPEPHDYEMLQQPDFILNNEGRIFLLRINNEIMGTAVLVHEGDNVYELAKMAIRPQAMGAGYGRMLCSHCIAVAKTLKAQKLYLVSNRKQETAIIMYKKLGFVEVPIRSAAYHRVDIQMDYKDL
jgi:putative acetyltransferase